MSDSNSNDERPETEAEKTASPTDASPTEASPTEASDAAPPAEADPSSESDAPVEIDPQLAGHGHGHGPPPGEKKYYFDYPENVQKVIRFFYIAAGLLLVADILVKFFHVPFHHHATFPEDATLAEGAFETWPFFYAFYGFAACVLLVLAATQLRKVIMRREDYYDRK